MIVLWGGEPLRGAVTLAGAKNAALPAIIASLLTEEPVLIENVPKLIDVDTAGALVAALGKNVERSGGAILLTGGEKLLPLSPVELVRRMRASFLALGPILAREGEAYMPLPGGCAIGPRPVDLHLQGLTALGADIEIQDGVVHARAPALLGTTVHLRYPSVGATEQLLLAGALAKGVTTIVNPAREPEVVDLSQLISLMGAEVEWGNGWVMVQGRDKLSGARHRLCADRIEAGTYLLAGAITQGEVRVDGAEPAHLSSLIDKLEETGAEVEAGDRWVQVRMNKRPAAVEVEDGPYPAFPTDLQPPMVALLALGQGRSLVRETVFESRFGHVDELNRLGANISLLGSTIVVDGVPALHGARVRATDIRAGAALIIAGLAAQSRTEVEGEEHLRRGYEDLACKLRALGAKVEESQPVEAVTWDQ